jgi:hypothetical protein
MSSIPLFLTLLSSLVGCSGEPATPPADTDKAAVTPADAGPPKLSPADLAGSAENIALVPSIIETQSALNMAGVQAKLADLLVERPFAVEGKDLDNVSVRTGVVIADMLLTVKSSSDEKLLSQLTEIKQGMAILGGGDDIAKTLDDISDRVKGKAVERDNLLKELDELSGAIIPELDFNGQKRIVPLIQAGSWLEGANLVARAVKQAKNPGGANQLLKQPAVCDYFIKYVKTEGAEKQPAAITSKLEESLNTLKGLAVKTEPFNDADIDAVIKTTDDVLSLM